MYEVGSCVKTLKASVLEISAHLNIV